MINIQNDYLAKVHINFFIHSKGVFFILKKIAILSISLITVMAGATISPALGEISSAFPDANQTLIKLINTMHALWVIPFTFISSLLTKRYTKKSILFIGLLLYVFGGISGAFATNIFFLLCTRSLLGIAVGLLMPISTSLVSDFYDGEERTDMMGKVAASNQLGGVISITVSGFLAALSWRFSFGVYGLAFIVLILIQLYLPNQAVPQKTGSIEHTPLAKEIYGLAFGMFLLFVFIYTIPTNMAIYLQKNQIADTTLSGVIISLSTIGGFIGGIMLTKFKHLMKNYFVPIQVFISGVGFCFIAFSSHVIIVSIGVFILGLASGTLIPIIYSSLSNIAKKNQMMTAMAIVQTFMYLGQFMSPIILDSVAEVFGSNTNQFVYAFSAYFTITLSIMIFIYKLGKNYFKVVK